MPVIEIEAASVAEGGVAVAVLSILTDGFFSILIVHFCTPCAPYVSQWLT